jgi:hypothetical protein
MYNTSLAEVSLIMKKPFFCFVSISLLLVLTGFAAAVDLSEKDIYETIERDYLELIDLHVAELSKEYGVSMETESLLVQRAVKNYIIADLVDYTLLIFMGKYNVATGGIEMKKANAGILKSLRDLSESANRQMLDNINALRIMKGHAPIVKGKPFPKSSGK